MSLIITFTLIRFAFEADPDGVFLPQHHLQQGNLLAKTERPVFFTMKESARRAGAENSKNIILIRTGIRKIILGGTFEVSS